MASNGSTRESLAWVGTLAVGAWLSVKVARGIAAAAGSMGTGRHAGMREEPVREIVEEVLSEHQAEDTPMVHAFEEALEAEEEEREPAQ